MNIFVRAHCISEEKSILGELKNGTSAKIEVKVAGKTFLIDGIVEKIDLPSNSFSVGDVSEPLRYAVCQCPLCEEIRAKQKGGGE